jgi:ERF superfamily
VNETAELAAALAAAQAELPEVKKNRSADVKNKEGRFLYAYSYADLADVSAAVLPVLGRHGLAFTAFPGHQQDGKFGLRYYLLHSSGAQLEGFFEIDDKGGMQLVGGRITYARRYCLCAVTGITADEDVDARDDGPSRTVQRRQTAGNGGQQPQSTAQRKPRNQMSPPAPEARPGAAPPSAERAGGDFPPLPGEEDAPGPDPAPPSGDVPAAGPGAPDDTDYDTPGTATRGKGGQLTALWTILSTEFGFTVAEKPQARAVCEHVVNRELAGGTTGNLSYNEAKTVLDTLGHWQYQAEREGKHPRDYMRALMVAQDTDPSDEDGEAHGE